MTVPTSGRSVSDVDKSLAIGLATALMSIFAFIPAPIMFGAVVDQSCLVWEEKPCGGGQGNCLFYDADKLRVYLHTAVIGESVWARWVGRMALIQKSLNSSLEAMSKE